MAGVTKHAERQVEWCTLCHTRPAAILANLPKRGLAAICSTCWKDCESADVLFGGQLDKWHTVYSRLKRRHPA